MNQAMSDCLILFSELFLRVGRASSLAISESHLLCCFVLSPNVAVSDAQPSAHCVASMINPLLRVVTMMIVTERTDRNNAGTRASTTHLCFHTIV